MKATFQEVAKMWSDAKRPIIKRTTMCAYMLTLQTHLLPRFGAATAITENDVQQFVLCKLSSGLAKKTVRDSTAGRVKGKQGSILVLVNRNDNGDILEYSVAQVDGEKIKDDVWYNLLNGQFAEVEE